MVVAQPANPATTTPIGRNYHYVELVCWFDLEPFLSSRADRIVARHGLCHETLVSLFQRGLHEPFDLLDVRGYDPWSKAFFGRNLGGYFPTDGVGLLDQGLTVNLQCVGGQPCQHGFDWDEQKQTDALECRFALRHSKASDLADVAVQHVCSPH